MELINATCTQVRVDNVIDEKLYLAFTEGWGDTEVVECSPLLESYIDDRLVLCEVKPLIFIAGSFLDGGRDKYFERVFLYDRFSKQRWLPLTDKVHVGVLVSQADDLNDLDVSKLQLVFWATVFRSRREAERALQALRGYPE